MSAGRRRFRGGAVLLGVVLLAGCAQDPRCEMLAEAFERQVELMRRVSEYVLAADPQRDTVEAMMQGLWVAESVLEDARDRARDAGCSDHGWCDAFQQGVEQTAELWRAWEELRRDSGSSAHSVYTWNAAIESNSLANVAREPAEAAGCACLPWSEAQEAWELYFPRRSADSYRALAVARTREAADTCWRR